MTLEQSQRTLARARAKAHKTVDDFPLVEISGVSNRLELRRVTGVLGAEGVFVDVTGVTEALIDDDLIRVWPQPDKAGIYKYHSFVKHAGENLAGNAFVSNLQTNLVTAPHGFAIEVFDAINQPGIGHQSKLEWSQNERTWRVHAANDETAAGLDVQKGNISLAAGYTVDGVDVSVLNDDAIKRTLVNAKGDLIVATADDTVTRLAAGGTDGSILIESSAAGTGLAWSTQLKLAATETVVNDAGADVDFRVEGDTDPNLFVADAGLDAIGFGGAAVSGQKVTMRGSTAGPGIILLLKSSDESTGSGIALSHAPFQVEDQDGHMLTRLHISGTQHWSFYNGGTVAYGAPGGEVGLVLWCEEDDWGLDISNRTDLIQKDDAFYITTYNPARIPLRIRAAASQTAHQQEWQKSDGTLYMSVSENGYLKIKKTAAPADAELDNNEMALWWDQANSKMMVKAKDNGGSVVSGELALS
jgi:hypothetical protein